MKIVKFAPDSMTLAKAADFYATQNNWRILPLHNVNDDGSCSCEKGTDCPTPGKHPRINNYVEAATTNPTTINGWWTKWPRANIGVYIDSRDGNRVAVIDIDKKPGVKDGDAVLKKIAEEANPADPPVLPATLTCNTPSGGRHHYFVYTEEQRVPGGANFRSKEFGDGLDVFTSHMMVVPPSTCGPNRNYKWDINCPRELAPYPAWMERRRAGRPAGSGKPGRPKKEVKLRASNLTHVAFVRHCLSFLDNANRDIWYKVGFALSRWFDRSDKGFAMFDEWSSKAHNYDKKKTREIYDEQACNATSDPISIGTLVFEAKQNSAWVDFDAEKAMGDKPWVFQYYIGNEHIAIGELQKLFHYCGIIFQQDNRLIRLQIVDDKTRNGMLWQPEGSAYIKGVTAQNIQSTYFPRYGYCWTYNMITGKGRQGVVPIALCQQFVEAGNWPTAHRFRALAEHPVVRDDGSLAEEEGFDEPSGMYLHNPCPVTVPEHPTLSDAKNAMLDLLEPFSAYTFEGDDSEQESVLLALLLTLGTRHLYPTAPAFAAIAPKPASGKTKLIQAAIYMWYGRTWPATSLSRDAEEIKKIVFSAALAGSRVMFFDNLAGGRAVNNETINAVLGGNTRIMDRILGSSEVTSAPNIATYLFTGNGVKFAGDMARRVLRLNIDPVVHNPMNRKFPFDPLVRMQANRERYLSAALTIIRAWYAAGAPKALGSFPTFEGWASIVRNIVMWVCGADPVAQVSVEMEDDEMEQSIGEAINALADMACDRVLYPDGECTGSHVEDADKFNREEWSHLFKGVWVVDGLLKLGSEGRKYEQALLMAQTYADYAKPHREAANRITHHSIVHKILTGAPGLMGVIHARLFADDESGVGYSIKLISDRKGYFLLEQRKNAANDSH